MICDFVGKLQKGFAKFWKRFASGKSPTFNWNNQKGNFASNSVHAETGMVRSLAELKGYELWPESQHNDPFADYGDNKIRGLSIKMQFW